MLYFTLFATPMIELSSKSKTLNEMLEKALEYIESCIDVCMWIVGSLVLSVSVYCVNWN